MIAALAIGAVIVTAVIVFVVRRKPRRSREVNLARLALLLAILCGALIESCGGGGSVTGGTGGGADRVALPLPPFTAWSTDLPAGEGTSTNPLAVSFSPNCIFGGVFPDCNKPLPLPTYSWSQSNSMATTRDFFRWRGVVNLEDTWEPHCNSGPPNQSLPLGVYPITWEPGDRSIRFGFELQNESALCQKIPYVSVSYVRGVQGDPQPLILPWGKDPQIIFLTRIDRSSDLPSHARHIYVWAHYRGKDGKRYMPHRVLWSSWDYPDDFAYSWNWSLAHSFQFAGMGLGPLLHGGRIGCEAAIEKTDVQGSIITDTLSAQSWTIHLEQLARCRFPELDQVKPDFLGFEIAAEGTYLFGMHVTTGMANRLLVTISDVGLSANP